MALAVYHPPSKPSGAPFVEKTYELVDHPATNHLISWCSRGSSFIVHNTDDFAKEVLPKYFKHSNFSSFVRQLNTYGFRKISARKWQFANERFLKGRRDLLGLIERRKPGCGAAPDLDRLTAHVHNTDMTKLAGASPRLPHKTQAQDLSSAVAAQAAAATSQLLQLALPNLQAAAVPEMASFLLQSVQPYVDMVLPTFGAHGSAFSPYIAPARALPAPVQQLHKLVPPAAALAARTPAHRWGNPNTHCKATATLEPTFLSAAQPANLPSKEEAHPAAAAMWEMREATEQLEEFDEAFPGSDDEVTVCSSEALGDWDCEEHSKPAVPLPRRSSDGSSTDEIMLDCSARHALRQHLPRKRSMEEDSTLPLKKRRFPAGSDCSSGGMQSSDENSLWGTDVSPVSGRSSGESVRTSSGSDVCQAGNVLRLDSTALRQLATTAVVAL